jgi:small conductance mechanosensitive channel
MILTPPLAHPTRTPLTLFFSRVQDAVTGDPGVQRAFLGWLIHFGVNLGVALLILIATLALSRWLGRLVRRGLGRSPSADNTLRTFVSSLVRWGIVTLGAVAVLQQLGVETTSILAVIGAASLAIGLAVQGALGNVAAGVMILVMRPYRIGDVVEINGKIGTVKRLDLFATELSDPDNLDIFMPNSKVLGEMIINYSTAANRRMELNFRVDYADDLDAALALLIACAKADKRILKDPAPWAKVTGLADSSVTLTLRAWTLLDVYWDARFDMIKRVKEALDAAGMSIPYPHQVAVTKGPAGPGPTSETLPPAAKK